MKLKRVIRPGDNVRDITKGITAIDVESVANSFLEYGETTSGDKHGWDIARTYAVNLLTSDMTTAGV